MSDSGLVTFDASPVSSVVTIEAAPVQALAALFDDGLDVRRGDPLPPLWHWVALPSWPRAGLTGVDGHPRTGGFLPDVGKPRRMFVGGSVELHAPLMVGDDVRRVDRVVSATPKQGKQGDFVLVEVETDLYSGHDLAVHEIQHLLYRDAPASSPASTIPSAPYDLAPRLLAREGGRWQLRTDPTKLMRFSSATSNGHRIHYDQPYATQVEGYPGLVVHGPLMTLSLAEVVRLTDDRMVRRLAHRNVRPLFCGQTAYVDLDGTGLVLVGESGPCVTLSLD